MFTITEYSLTQFEVRGCMYEEGVNGVYQRCYPTMKSLGGELSEDEPRENCVVFKHVSKKFQLVCFLDGLVSHVARAATDIERAKHANEHGRWYEQGEAMRLDFGEYAGLSFLTVLHRDFSFCREVLAKKDKDQRAFRDWLKHGNLFNFRKPSGLQMQAGARSITDILGRIPTQEDYKPTHATGRGLVFPAKELWNGAVLLKWSTFPRGPWPPLKPRPQVEEPRAGVTIADVRTAPEEQVYRLSAATVHLQEDEQLEAL
jgi:hypothetical protein